ncbi:hypothetical protein BGZ49_003776, partial [Haplosporangium sp. Z 27]
ANLKIGKPGIAGFLGLTTLQVMRIINITLPVEWQQDISVARNSSATTLHSHPLASQEDVGTQYLSDSAKLTIKFMLQGGSLVREVLQRMQAKSNIIARYGKTRIFRDDTIIYEDMYNVFNEMMASETRKDDDPDISAQRWLEELAGEGYFTCYKSGEYYGFAAPWQLQ